jgi:hypothetical protein
MTAETHLVRVDVPFPHEGPRVLSIEGWTPAHSEAALFLGGCLAVGAVLGMATELARPLWERHG